MGRKKYIVEEVEEKKGFDVVGCGCLIIVVGVVLAALRSCLGCAG